MDYWITKSFTTIKDIIVRVEKTYPTIKLRIAVIIYKDFEVNDGKCEILDFTEDGKKVVEFLKSIKTQKINCLDTAENVNGAY